MDTIVIQDNDTTISLNPSTIVAGAIGSVNGQTGEVLLTAADVGADAAGAADAVRYTLATQIASKAAQVDVDTLADQVKTKADAADLTTLTDALATKADKSALEQVSATVATKADQADLAAAKTVLMQKADAAALADYTKKSDFQVTKNLAEVNNLNIGLKADQADLDATDQQVADIQQTLLTKADVAALTVLSQLVNTKADQSYVISEIARITGNAPAALDTLSEIAAQLGKDESQIQTLLDAVGNRVRFDTTQTLSVSQQQQTRDNINAEQKGTAQALVSAITSASIGAATAAQGNKADTALQSGDVAPVALSGSFSSLSNQNKIFDVVYSAFALGANAAITAADTLGQMLSKLQAQVSANATSSANNAAAIAANTMFLPPKIGQKWYVSGRRYDAVFPRPYNNVQSSSFNSGYQYFVPFVPVETVTISGLEVSCFTGQSGATIAMGIYDSTTNNDVGVPLFTSQNIDCSASGLKSASCSLTLTAGKVYWMSCLVRASGTMASFIFISASNCNAFVGPVDAGPNASYAYAITNQTTMSNAPAGKFGFGGITPRVCFIVA